MADSTYAVKVSEEVKEKLQKLIEESGQSSKDFFADMISQFELVNTKKQAPILSADIDELVNLTTRINNIFINIGERVANLQEACRSELRNELKEKESLISLLQSQVENLNLTVIQREDQIVLLSSTKESLKKEKEEVEKVYITEVNRLTEVNQKNNEIIAGHTDKINTLSGLVNEYKGFAEENKVLKQETFEAQRITDKLQQENEKLRAALSEKENQIQNIQEEYVGRMNELRQQHSEEIERQKEKLELERDRALLEQREQYNRELDEIRNTYQDKINQLLQISSKPKPKAEPKKKA